MRIIRTTKYAMLRRLWAVAIILVFLCAVFPALADTPPKGLLAYVSSYKLVHDKQCNFHEMKHVECIIFYDEGRDIVWLVLFDKKKDELAITHVIGIKDKDETVIWCRQDICI